MTESEKYYYILDYLKDLSRLKESILDHHRMVGQIAYDILNKIGELE